LEFNQGHMMNTNACQFFTTIRKAMLWNKLYYANEASGYLHMMDTIYSFNWE
jgi:hypothetical protein